ncbi:MAG: asparagine synthase (glutamine-hydrolyzing) [Proteobacteria bacterium]|nr:asparagine synthase (glutamine-hydrolyzing) [Pseudomonadota bacterium]
MCGIAGIIRIDGGLPIPRGVVKFMTDAIHHRGPDEEGFFEAPGLCVGSRRLAIIDVDNGTQPVTNETATVHAVFNGELFDYPERKRQLQQRGHKFTTCCDTELLPHLWEDHHEEMFLSLRGQFALAIFDTKARRLTLARDRFGICPLYWTVQRTPQGSFLLFASEIKALLSSGMVTAQPDIRGIDHTFSFFALPGPITCFDGISSLRPGHFMTIDLGPNGQSATITEKAYWEIDFPDRGEEERCSELSVERYKNLFRQSVERRLRADVPVVSYLSGGIDSSIVLAVAKELRAKTPPAFTLQINAPGLDEAPKAKEVADVLGADQTTIAVSTADILAAYPGLIEAAECPVSDTCCSALLLLAREVHTQGYKVALTGEGADETLAGYPWFKLNRLMAPVDALGFKTSYLCRRTLTALLQLPNNSMAYDRRTFEAAGGSNAWLDLYGLVSAGKGRVYGPKLKPLLNSYVAYEDLGLNIEKMKRWHPLNRSLYLGQRIHLPGLLLSIAGDRVAMHSSVETRYPFLDEDLTEFVQGLDPAWKLRRFQDKYLLRRAAESALPKSIAWRPKAMFRAPWDVLDQHETGGYLTPLLSSRALEETGYFDTKMVRGHLTRLPGIKGVKRTLLEQTLAGVVMTQLWHHIFIGDLGAPVERLRVRAKTKHELSG